MEPGKDIRVAEDERNEVDERIRSSWLLAKACSDHLPIKN
jgi:hypothetical protein